MINRYPVMVFFLLTLILSWGGIYFVIGLEGMLGSKPIDEEQMPMVYLATLLGPSLAAIIMISLLDGVAGLKALWGRLSQWRVSPFWYVVSLLLAPVLITTLLLLLSLTSSDFIPVVFTSANTINLLFTAVIVGIVVGLFEELGWTGFAIPRLRKQFGQFKTGLYIGLFWGFWHLPLFIGLANLVEGISVYIYLPVLLFSFLPAYRVLMVWVYDHTQSLLMAVLMHAPLVVSQFVLIPMALTGRQVVIYDVLFSIVLWIVAIVIIRKQQHN